MKHGACIKLFVKSQEFDWGTHACLGPYSTIARTQLLAFTITDLSIKSR